MRRPFAKFCSLSRGQRGFSLIELMITITVAAVLLALAIPSFRDTLIRNELTTANNDWVAAANMARAEAIKRSANVVICGANTPGSGLGSNGDGHPDGGCSAALAGQVRYVPQDGGNAQTLRDAIAPDLGGNVQVSSSRTIIFRPDGIGYDWNSILNPYNTDPPDNDPSVVLLCTDAFSAENARRVNLVSGSIVESGRATVASCP